MTDLIGDFEDFLSAVGELIHDEVAAEQVKTSLKSIIDAAEGDTFDYMGTIQEDSFGTTSHATGLTLHHGLAHQVMDETLKGITADMHAFLTNVTKASELISLTDENSGADVAKRQQVINSLSYLDHNSHETSARNHARNHQHRPWSTPDTAGDN